MRNKLVFIFLFSIILGQDLNQVSLEIRDSNQASWWSKKNNNGLNPSKSYFSFSINKQFDKYDFFVSSYINKEEIILGESFINIEFLPNYYLKLGRYYRDFSSYLKKEDVNFDEYFTKKEFDQNIKKFIEENPDYILGVLREYQSEQNKLEQEKTNQKNI